MNSFGTAKEMENDSHCNKHSRNSDLKTNAAPSWSSRSMLSRSENTKTETLPSAMQLSLFWISTSEVRTATDAAACVPCWLHRRTDSLWLSANSQCLCSFRVPKILFSPWTGLRTSKQATFAAQGLKISTFSKSKTESCQKVCPQLMCSVLVLIDRRSKHSQFWSAWSRSCLIICSNCVNKWSKLLCTCTCICSCFLLFPLSI